MGSSDQGTTVNGVKQIWTLLVKSPLNILGLR